MSDSHKMFYCGCRGEPGHYLWDEQHGWSAVSWWDNSVDSRPGSHSTFVAEGTHQPMELLEMARARFPWVFARFGYEVAYGREMSIEVGVT